MKFFISALVLVIHICASPGNSAELETLNSAVNTQNEFQQFLDSISCKERVFLELFEISRQELDQVLNLLCESKPLDLNLKTKTLESINKAHIKLDEFESTAAKFQGSSNSEIRKVVKEILKFIEYGHYVLKGNYEFILSPEEFIAIDEKLNKLIEYQTLMKKQNEYVVQLVEEVLEQ